ncbi:hypothetical protein [Amycolatopsis sp. NPDC051903]|uniref:hypothetical protein n=1 Tax=Amycolatopsis sp. NPDC051903 TaxID=3363936 RepID=UPI0037B290AA
MTDEATGGPADPERDPRWELVRAAAHRRVATPPGLVDRVLRSLAVEREGPPLSLAAEDGPLAVSEAALVRLARTVATDQAEDVDGVMVSAVALEGGELQVLTTVRFGTAAGEAARTLQRHLTDELARLLRARPPVVNVHVIDVQPN